MIDVFLVKHAQSVPSAEVPEPDWPLSAKGRKDAIVLSSHLQQLNITELYSSPYLRAKETIGPLANELATEIVLIDGVREKKLSVGFLDNFAEVVLRAWQDFDFKMPECESNCDAQLRVAKAINSIVAPLADGSRIAIASHGHAIGLFLNHIDPNFGYEKWRAMTMPDVFRVCFDGAWHWDKDFKIEISSKDK